MNMEMRCGILSNAKGEIVIIHDRGMKSPVQWVEYHVGDNKIFLIHEDGSSQNLGLEIDGRMKGNLSHGVGITLVRIVDGKVGATQKVSLMIQDY